MYKVNGSIWIESDKAAFMGVGRIHLLERIREHGSITLAARSMKMSYRQAWELVNSMNSLSKHPVVKAVSGGKGGGGTVVTEEGERVIRIYRELGERFREFCKEETNKLRL